VDTPGVLSGEKQRTQRSYDFTGVTSWFAAKCDLILLLFDPHKLDISDEFKRVISSLRGHDDKIRVVLNKADQVDTQQVQFFLAITLYGLLCLLLWWAGSTRERGGVVAERRGGNARGALGAVTAPQAGFPLRRELLDRERN